MNHYFGILITVIRSSDAGIFKQPLATGAEYNLIFCETETAANRDDYSGMGAIFFNVAGV